MLGFSRANPLRRDENLRWLYATLAGKYADRRCTVTAPYRRLCTAYVCTIADRYMLAERMNNPLESDEGVPVADMVHWCHPSAEMVAESREVEP